MRSRGSTPGFAGKELEAHRPGCWETIRAGGERWDVGPGQEMLSEQTPAHLHRLPWVPAATTAGHRGHPHMQPAGYRNTELAHSPQTAQQCYTSQRRGKMHPQGKVIFNKASKQVEQQEPKGKRAPSSLLLFCTRTSPPATSSGTGFSVTSRPGKPHTVLLCSSSPTLCSYPAFAREGAEEANVTWPDWPTPRNSPVKLTQPSEQN